MEYFVDSYDTKVPVSSLEVIGQQDDEYVTLILKIKKRAFDTQVEISKTKKEIIKLQEKQRFLELCQERM